MRSRTVAFLLRYFRRYTGWGALALLAVLTYALASIATVALVEPIFGELLQIDPAEVPSSVPFGTSQVESGEGKEEGIALGFDLDEALRTGYASLKARLGIDADTVVYFIPLLLVIALLLRSLGSFFSGYSFQHIGLGMTTDMRNDLFQRVIEQSSRFHEQHTSGELLSRVVNDVTVMQNAVTSRLLDLFQQTPMLLGLIVYVFTIDARLAVVVLVALPVFIYPIARFGRGMWKTSHRSQERMADLAELLGEATRGHTVVKAFGMEQFEVERFRQATFRHLVVKLRAQVLTYLSGPVVESLAAIGAAVFLVYAGNAVRQGGLTAPVLLKFSVAVFMMYDPIRKLNKVNLVLQEARAAVQRVSGLLAVPNEIQEVESPKRLREFRESIGFEAVTFGYEEGAVLRGLNLEIARGEVVALVGPSGAGKSTLVNLLPRFFDPDEGRITIDGLDIRELALADLRGLIGLVTQETVLFDDTVRNNIAYGREDLSLERVREAAAAAYADEFIAEMSRGYETPIGEAGLRLSGGQRQRLTIARAILKNAPILILDEATSHLDSESEALVQKALYNLMRGRTALVIAHRLSTVTSADRIVVMEQGQITETGSHEELLAQGGTYQRLYELQFRT